MLCALRTLEGRRQAASTVISGSNPITFIPSLIAVSATMLPIAPRPMMPSVRPGSSTPANCFFPSSTSRSRSGVSRLERRHVAERRYHVARGDEQRGQHELLHCVGVCAGRIEHRRAAFRHFRDGNVVGARPGAADRADTRGDRHLLHVAGTHEDSRRGDRLRRPRIYRVSGKRRSPMLAIGLSVRI